MFLIFILIIDYFVKYFIHKKHNLENIIDFDFCKKSFEVSYSLIFIEKIKKNGINYLKKLCYL